MYTAFTVEGGMNDPFRVRWPVNGDHTDWVGVGSGFNDLTDEIYQLQNIKKLLDTLVVYAERSITLATKTGNSLGPATFALQVKDVGLASPFTLQAFNTLHFFLGTDNLYVFQGTTVVPIGDSCRATIFNQLNPNQLPFNFALLLYESQEYACFVATGGNTTTDTAWVYNFQRQCLYPWKFANPRFTCGAIHYLDSSVTIGALSGTIAEQTWVIGSFTLSANFPIPVLGGSTGEVFTLTPGVLSDNGHPIPCRWTSKDYTAKDIDPSLGNDMITLREVGLEYVDPGTAFTLQFYFSIDRGKSWSGPFPITVGGGPVGSVGDTMCTRQVTGRRIRFKVENTTINELPQIQSFSPTLELRRQKVT